MTSEIQVIDLGFVNCYLVRARQGYILVDTGMRSQRDILEKALIGAGCQPGDLTLIMLTHGDIDHAGNCAYLRDRYQTRIAMHRKDVALVSGDELQPKRKAKSLLLRSMHLLMRFSGATKKMMTEFNRFQPDIYLEDGESLKEYGVEASVLHLPGHTPGSIGLLTGNGELICGDTLENRNGLHPTQIVDNEATLTASLERLSRLENIATVYPGHGKPFSWKQFARRYGKNHANGNRRASSELEGPSAIGLMASVIGGVLGLAGFEHGFFEVLHGNVALKIGTIEAIGEANRLWLRATEPAFTLIPNFLVTGIAAMAISLLVILWAVWFVRRRRNGGLILLLLCILQFLVGGGKAPFGMAIVIGIAALWIDQPLTWGWPILPAGLQRILALPWLFFVIALASIFAMTIECAVFGLLPGVTAPEHVASLLLDLLYIMEGLLPLLIISVFAHDSLRWDRRGHAMRSRIQAPEYR